MNNKEHKPRREVSYHAVVMGGSAGGFKAFIAILSSLPKDYALPILLVQHLHHNDDGMFSRHLSNALKIPVIEPYDKQTIEPGIVYTAPADYHMLVEMNKTIALSTDEKVNWSRPSIDVLFESAALCYGNRVIGIILSGASADGTVGMGAIKTAGGLTMAQDPNSSAYPVMPQAAIDAGVVDYILTAEKIGNKLMALGQKSNQHQ
ncbi:MAG: chemotaxis protein CheB [Proteobacteria bacterium]|nr:chemotaxis protein CheB [Pseudomonadota bacterium]